MGGQIHTGYTEILGAIVQIDISHSCFYKFYLYIKGNPMGDLVTPVGLIIAQLQFYLVFLNLHAHV